MSSKKPRYQKRSSTAFALTDGQQMHLLLGSTYFNDGFRDLESFTDAWELHADELTEVWVRDYRKKWFSSCEFLRPFAWWRIDHGKERRIVNPEFPREEVSMMRADNRHGEKFGFLHTAIIGGKRWSYLQETEAVSLERLGLLTDEEREFIATLEIEDDQ